MHVNYLDRDNYNMMLYNTPLIRDLNQPLNNILTALMLAASNGHVQTVEILLKRKN